MINDSKNQEEKQKILLAMYRSIDRMNLHYSKGNDHGVMAETSLQINLRHNFNEVSNHGK